MHKKLFIPGPTEVRDEILQAMATPMIGHRTGAYADLHKSRRREGQEAAQHRRTGVPLHLLLHRRHGRRDPQLRREKGAQHPQRRVLPALVRDLPRPAACRPRRSRSSPARRSPRSSWTQPWPTAAIDTLCLTENETSTGIISPVAEIAKLVRAKYPDIIILVDAVSCMAGVEIEIDEWGLDV